MMPSGVTSDLTRGWSSSKDTLVYKYIFEQTAELLIIKQVAHTDALRV
jgi:hypothetical protein